MPHDMSRLTVERLREVLYYDEATGIFTWKKTTSPNSGRAREGQRAGTTNYQGYRVITIDRALFRSGRLAWFYKHGRWPAPEIDHENRVRDDDRLSNLREATRAEQLANRAA